MNRLVFRRDRYTRRWLNLAIAVTLALSVVLLGVGNRPAQAATPRHYTELDFAPLPEIKLPEYTRFELDNGMVVYLVEDHELPLVSGSALFRTGDRYETSEKVGLAGMMGDVMRTGGTLQHPPDELNQLLERRAAGIETGVDAVSGTASFSALSEDLDEVFGLFAEVIRYPAFPQDKLDLEKTQRRGAIARRNDDPGNISTREFQKLVYGNMSPYARTIEYATLDSISRDDVVQFYQQYIRPDRTLLGLVGDFDTAEMRAKIEANFGDWQAPSSAHAATTLPEVKQANVGGVFLVDQPQLTQSYIQIGHLGGRLDDADHAPLTVLNEVLNGFGGRLVNEVRSRQGLAYVVYAVWSPRFDYPGIFVGGGQTRTETTVQFIKSVMAEIETVRIEPVTDQELARAKDSVLNGFIFNFQTTGQTLSRLMRYEYFGYPSDFIFTYQRNVEATTADQIQKAAQRHLKPENLVTLVVGNRSGMTPDLSSLTPGKSVVPVDITIPPANS